jgi:hypothetical protein
MDLFNVETGNLESLPDDLAEQAFLTGTHAFKKGDFANVIDREDGTVLKVPVDKAAEYLKNGFAFETDEERALRQARNDPENKSLVGTAKAFGESAADMATFGVSGVVQKSLEEETDTAKREARQEENPIASTLGSITGFAGSLLYGGPVLKGVTLAGTAAEQAVVKAAQVGGKKLAQSVATKAVSTIAKRAVENATIMAPSRITEAVLGDSDTAAETLLANVSQDLTFGAAFGAAEGFLTPVLKATGKLASRAITPEKLNELADDFRLRQQGFKTQDIRAAKKAGRTKSADDAREKLIDFMDNYNIGNLKTIFEAPEETWSRLEGLQQESTKIMNQIRETADRTTAGKGGLTASQLAKPLKQIFSQYDNTMGKEASSSFNDIKTVAKLADDLFSGKKNYLNEETLSKLIADGRVSKEALSGKVRTGVSFEEAHALKNEIDNFVFAKNPITNMRSNVAISQGALDARNLLVDTIDNNIALISGKSGMKKALDKAKKTYGDIENLGRKVFQASSERISTHNKFSLTDALNATIGAAAYGNIAGAIAVGAGSKAMRTYGNQLAASSLKGLASVMENSSQKVNTALNQLLTSPKTRAVKPGAVFALNKFLGDEASGKNDAEKIAEIANQLSIATANPDLTTQAMTAATKKFSQHAPQVTQSLNTKFGTALEYLTAEIPKPNFQTSAFNPAPWEPSDREVSAFKRKLHAVMDPFSVIDEIATGTLTKESVQALSAVYPSIFSLLKEKISERISTAKPSEVFKLRRKLGLFLGESMGISADPGKVMALQVNFKDNRDQSKIQANSKITEAARTTTDIDRLTNQ